MLKGKKPFGSGFQIRKIIKVTDFIPGRHGINKLQHSHFSIQVPHGLLKLSCGRKSASSHNEIYF